MKQSLKELLSNLIKPTTCTAVTMPYTPPCNGLLQVNLRASQTGRFYIVYSNAKPGIVDGYATSGCYVQATLFVEKGKKVSISDSYCIQGQEYYFIPVAVGGVLHKRVSNLQITTSERRWCAC